MEVFQQLSAESIPKFQEIISLTLSTWDAFDAGMADGFGTPSQFQNFASRIFNFFHQPNRKEPIYIDDLENLLWNGLVSLGIAALDSSVEEVAEDLMVKHLECLKGQYESIQELNEEKIKMASVVRQIVNACDDSDEDEDEDDDVSDMMVDSHESLPNVYPTPVQRCESSPQQMGVDEDGWYTVSSRKNRRQNC